jgi:predicted metal-dependent hydrolase
MGIIMSGKITAGDNGMSELELKVNLRTINIDGIGAVNFRHSRRARRIIISVSPTKGIRVSVPGRTSLQKALEFVETKRRWIQKHLALIKENEQRRQVLGLTLQTIDKVKAKQKLTTRLYNLAEMHRFTCNKVTVRQQKTRWGSCSPKNNISLNVKLVLLPEPLADYVILHELVHTRIHNHSRRFWAELDKYVKNSKAASRQLRMNEMLLL